MAHLPINADDSFDPTLLRSTLNALAPKAPVVLMIHGYKFCPHNTPHDPHRHILSQHPIPDRPRAVSWPQKMQLNGDNGLAIAFAWSARGNIWQAHRAAERAGLRLAALLQMIRRFAPDHPVHILAHSLGARVALTALPILAADHVHRMVLISAAMFRSEALALLSSEAGRSVEVFNVTGRENTFYDVLLRLAKPLSGATTGRGVPCPNWLNLPLDRPHVLTQLSHLGFAVQRPNRPICHWSGYLRPSVWPLYRGLLLQPQTTPIEHLRTHLRVDQPPKRRFSTNRPLSFWTGTAS